MNENVAIRRQATLYFNQPPTGLIESRLRYNPVQANLIAPHVTLCREDEVTDWSAFEQRVAARLPIKLHMKFGEPTKNGNSVLLPAITGALEFAALRRDLLFDGASEPRPMNAHVTIIHPRNGVCTEEIFAEIKRLLLPFEATFREVSLIEQHQGGPWKTLSRYS